MVMIMIYINFVELHSLMIYLFIRNSCDTDFAQAEPNFALSKGTTILCTYVNMNNQHKHIDSIEDHKLKYSITSFYFAVVM